MKKIAGIHPISWILLGFILLICIFPEFFATADPLDGSLRDAYQAPNDVNICGTDVYGRDVFSRIIYGIRLSFCLSVAVVTIIVVTGTSFGLLAGYMGGVTDNMVSTLCNILISCPSMVLAIALAGILGPSVENAMIAIFVVTISKYIRLSRSLVLQITSQDYIKGAKIGGAKPFQLLTRHILPNILPTLLITATTDLGTVILELSALSFLGFGVPAPLPELGLMMNEGRAYILSAPWMVFCPGFAIFALVSVVNLISDQLRDQL